MDKKTYLVFTTYSLFTSRSNTCYHVRRCVVFYDLTLVACQIKLLVRKNSMKWLQSQCEIKFYKPPIVTTVYESRPNWRKWEPSMMSRVPPLAPPNFGMILVINGIMPLVLLSFICPCVTWKRAKALIKLSMLIQFILAGCFKTVLLFLLSEKEHAA